MASLNHLLLLLRLNRKPISISNSRRPLKALTASRTSSSRHNNNRMRWSYLKTNPIRTLASWRLLLPPTTRSDKLRRSFRLRNNRTNGLSAAADRVPLVPLLTHSPLLRRQLLHRPLPLLFIIPTPLLQSLQRRMIT